MLVPGLLALVFGWLAFRSRVTGVYLSIITQAMTYALMLAFFRNDMGFGGNNGMTDYKDILGWDVHEAVHPPRPLPRLGRGARHRLSVVPRHYRTPSSGGCFWHCATPRAGCGFSAIR